MGGDGLHRSGSQLWSLGSAPLSGQWTNSYVLGPGAPILPCLSLRAGSAPSKLRSALLTHGSWAAAASQPVSPKLLLSCRIQGVVGAPRAFPLTDLRKAELRKLPTGFRMQFFSEPSVCPRPLAVCSREGRERGIVHKVIRPWALPPSGPINSSGSEVPFIGTFTAICTVPFRVPVSVCYLPRTSRPRIWPNIPALESQGSLGTRFQNFPPSAPCPRPSYWWRGRCGTLP